MDRSSHGDDLDDDEGLYAEPTLPPSSRPQHDPSSHPEAITRAESQSAEDQAESHRDESSSPQLSSVARSSSHTATTARSIASTNLSTLATSASHGSSNMAQDSKDVAAVRARQQQHAPPKMTIFDLESDTATSSALPQPFGFSISRKGQMVAVFGTKNIWILEAKKLPKTCVRTLEVRRKPVAVEIMDDGSLLAVLSNPFKVDLYRLQADGAPGLEKVKSIILTVDAHTIALSPDGMVLATGHPFGIELVSLAEKASEHDRRSVNCDPMDHLMFSDDGRTLIATASARMPRPTTVFSVHGAFDGPLTEDGDLIPQECHIAWTRQILFPEKAHTAKHALILPDPLTGHVNELFAFDAEEDTWGIYDLGGMQFIETKENPPEAGHFVHAESLEDALPTVSPSYDHVAVAVKNQDSNAFWVFRIPDTYESSSAVYHDLKRHSGDHSPLAPCSYVSMPREEDTSAQDISGLRWIACDENDCAFERLLAVGNMVCSTAPDTPIMPGDAAKTKGILITMDFDFGKSLEGHSPSKAERITIDLDQTLPGEKLPEDEIDFEREVELVRTRTVAQRRGEAARAVAGHTLLRSSTTTSPQNSSRATTSRPDNDDDGQAVFEEPYVQGQPRSQASLSRAATVAAASPANRRHLRALPDRPLEYRRADGLREMPHESDADNWIPPPPPYTPRADPPGPGAISISLSHPEGAPLPTVPSPPLAQNSTLPRLQIPNGHSSSHPLIPSSAPADRGHPTPQLISAAAPHSANPLSRAPRIARPDSHRYSHPSSQSRRPGTGSRNHTSPSQAPFRPPPEDPVETSFHPPATLSSNPHSEHFASHGPPRQSSPGVSPTEQIPAPQQSLPPNFNRSDSVPTPVHAFGINPRAAQSVDDFGAGPTARRRAGIRGLRRLGRGQGEVQRMATIRSVRSTGAMRIRSASAPLAGDDAVDTPGSRDGDGFRKRMRCVVM